MIESDPDPLLLTNLNICLAPKFKTMTLFLSDVSVPISFVWGIVSRYSKEMEQLAKRLLSIISQSLNLPPSYIEDAVGDVYQNITVSYYPPCARPDLVLGLQSHSDMRAITLMIQDDVGGLEVLKNDKWFLVQPLQVAIVVILADMTEVMTNGAYKSAVHCALVNRNMPRISVATFYDPQKTRKIYPAPQLITAEAPAKYREVTYGDFVKSRYNCRSSSEVQRNVDALWINKRASLLFLNKRRILVYELLCRENELEYYLVQAVAK